jgi:hypothetical protein
VLITINEIAAVQIANVNNSFFEFMVYPPFFDSTFALQAKVVVMVPVRNALLCKLLQGFALHF